MAGTGKVPIQNVQWLTSSPSWFLKDLFNKEDVARPLFI